MYRFFDSANTVPPCALSPFLPETSGRCLFSKGVWHDSRSVCCIGEMEADGPQEEGATFLKILLGFISKTARCESASIALRSFFVRI